MTKEIGTLAIKRREGESFLIGNEILITVVRIKGKEAAITIRAPKSIRIERLKTKMLNKEQKQEEKT